ncbi:MAG: BTAD domain-containing putative transcriptional regulator [Jiangellaceae bacterium]
MDAPWKLRLLGGWRLFRGGTPVELTPSPQRLVALLALTGRPSRGYVAGVLWPDEPESYGRNNLRALLSRLRQRSFGGLIHHGDTGLALEDDVAVDVDDLRRCVAALHSDGATGVDRGELIGLLTAGELLPGWYDDWVLGERERLRQAQLHTVELLCDIWSAEGDQAAALDAALLAVRLDPLRESAHRRAVAVHLEEGNVAEALRQFHRYERLLDDELHISPTEQMRDLVAPFLGSGHGNAGVTVRSRHATHSGGY